MSCSASPRFATAADFRSLLPSCPCPSNSSNSMHAADLDDEDDEEESELPATVK